MEANVQSRYIPVYKGLTDSYFELPIETEILVPDYIAEVFRIIKCTVGHTIFQKSLVSGKILIEGYHKVSVYYQAENNTAVCKLEQKLPFSKSVEYRGDIDAEHRITVTGQCEYLNCRAINQRRIDVRGSYGMTATVKAFAQAEVITDIESTSIYQKYDELKYTNYLTTVEKQFTIEQDVEFYETPSSILYSFAGCGISSYEQVGDRIILKGEMKAAISYISTDGTFIKESKNISFQQVVEIQEEQDGVIACPSAVVTGCNVLESDGDGYILSLSCSMSVSLYNEQSQPVVTDAFSADTGYITGYDRLDILTGREYINNEMTLTIPATLSGDIVSVVDSFATIGSIKIQPGETGYNLLGELTAHLICENDLGELFCLDNSGDYRINVSGKISEDSYIDITPSIITTSCNFSAGEATVEISLCINGIICSRSGYNALKEIEITEQEKTGEDAAICIYFADAGEAVFDIAKRYGASPQGIMTHNNLTDETLKTKQRLIVPV